MPYIPESSKYSEFIYLIWKCLNMTSFSITSYKKAISVFKEDYVQIPTQEKSDPLFLSEWPSKVSGRSSVSNICPDDVAIPSRLPSVSRRFEQFNVASVRTSWQHVQTHIRVQQHRPDVILNKARRGEELQPSRRQGNTVRTRSLL
jgi:hypothetical protein